MLSLHSFCRQDGGSSTPPRPQIAALPPGFPSPCAWIRPSPPPGVASEAARRKHRDGHHPICASTSARALPRIRHGELSINVASSVMFNLPKHQMDLLLHLLLSSFRLAWPLWRWHSNCSRDLDFRVCADTSRRFFHAFILEQSFIAVGKELFMLE